MSKFQPKDIKTLSNDNLKWLQRVLNQELETRKEKDNSVELIYYDDGCEGSYMTWEDFEECARKKDDYGNDLIDYIAGDLNRYEGASITLSTGKYNPDEMGHENFIGKENPFYKEEDE